jgi:hypothetical protein
MAIHVYVASIPDDSSAYSDGLKVANEVNKIAVEEGRATSVDELERVRRERVHPDDILLYGLGVYCREGELCATELSAN